MNWILVIFVMVLLGILLQQTHKLGNGNWKVGFRKLMDMGYQTPEDVDAEIVEVLIKLAERQDRFAKGWSIELQPSNPGRSPVVRFVSNGPRNGGVYNYYSVEDFLKAWSPPEEEK